MNLPIRIIVKNDQGTFVDICECENPFRKSGKFMNVFQRIINNALRDGNTVLIERIAEKVS